MRKTAFIIMLITVASKLLGFSREVFLAYFYGASDISDVYLVSCAISGVIISLIGTGISTSFIPLCGKIRKEEGVKSSIAFVNDVINSLFFIIMLITILVLLFTPGIVKVFASGFEGKTFNLAVTFTRISILGVFFYVLMYVFIGFLQINNNFIVPALVSVPFNLLTIIFIFLSTKTNILLLAIGNVLSRISELLFLILFAKKYEFTYKLNIDLNDKYLKEMLLLSLPVIIGVSVDQINVLIDNAIASGITTGGISALNYSSRLNSFVQGIFVIPITTVMYPLIAQLVVEKNMNKLKKTISEAINGIILLVIPATIGSIVFAEPVVRLLFGRGAFTAVAVDLTAGALLFYSIGMIGFGLREILSRVFYSFQDTKTPMFNGVFGIFLNIILNIILSKILGINGLALATSISAIFTTGLLFISLRKRIGPFGSRDIIISLLKILCASLVMSATARFSFNCLSSVINQNSSLLISIGIGVIVYFVIIIYMKIDDVEIIVDTVKKKLKSITANI